MTPERYKRICDIFAVAADLEGDARSEYLNAECGGDEALRREVLSMLDADGDDVVVSPQPLTSEPEEDGRHDFSGRTLGRYRVAVKIGEGGMSTVYRAEDTKLGRTVALKFLAPELLRSEQARARFLREARASAALDHPNICTTYDMEQIEGHSFISMALLEGQTLAQRLQSGPLPIKEAVDVARQAARGLHAAHLKGVVHRDVKPGNLMLLESGVVKVMDFGVARLLHGETLTQSGMTMGTIAYMSPEQIEGAAVDGRSDIWALGAVLYEMLAGRQPFDRPTTREALAAIRGAEPRSILDVRPDTPAALAEAIARCLRKDPADRYASARDLRAHLDEIYDQLRTQELTAEGPVLTRPSLGLTRRALPWAAAILLAVGFLWALNRPQGEESPTAAPLVPEKFTSLAGFETEPAISPDGTRIAFVWDGGASRQTDLYVQLLGSYEPLRITNTPDTERNPVWSPDGTRLAFLRQTGSGSADSLASVMIVPALGGPELRVADIQAHPFRSVLDWSPDGHFLAASDNGEVVLLPVDQAQTADSTLPARIGSGFSPKFDPAGKRIAFVNLAPGGTVNLHVAPASGGESVVYPGGARSFDWNAAGNALVLSREGARPLRILHLDDGSVSNIPVSGIRRVSSLDVRGDLLAAAEARQNVNLWAVDLDAGSGQVGEPFRLVSSSSAQVSPRFSPSGDRIVFSSDRLGEYEIWLSDRDGTNARKLAGFEGGAAGTPRWSPDGRTVVFDAQPADDITQIWSVSVDDGKVRQLTSAFRNVMPSWSPDGEWIYFCSFRDGGRYVYRMRPDGSEATEVPDTLGWETQPSPDGRYLYYSRPDGDVTLFRLDLQNRETTEIPEVGAAGAVRYWALAEHGIYFVDNRSDAGWIQFLDFASHGTTKVAPIGALADGPGGVTLSPDGRTLLYAQRDADDSDIVLLRGFE